MSTQMYVPKGFTRNDVRYAMKELPDPLRYSMSTGNRTVRIAVPNFVDECGQVAPPSADFLANRNNYAECTAYMKILDFDLLAEYDYYTGKIAYVWKLVRGNQA